MEIKYKSKYDIEDALNKIAPEDDYRNGVIGKIIEMGKKEKMDENWVRRAVLMDYEDGFIDYETSVRLYWLYIEFLSNKFIKVA